MIKQPEEKNLTVNNNSTIDHKTENVTKKIEMQRITQPVAQTQQIERTTIVLTNTTSPSTYNNYERSSSSSSAGRNESSRKSGEFRPSPHLETYYEFNKFPVVPAFPEAKQIHHHTHYDWGETPSSPISGWGGNAGPTRPEKSVATTPQSHWKVKFPAPNVETSRDRPYQFYNEKSHQEFPSKSDDFPSNKPSFSSSGGFWDNHETNKPQYNSHREPHQIHKNNFDFTAKVPTIFGGGGGESHKTHLEPHYEVGHHHQQEDGNLGLPWKKIIKFLTAFIPIGLLISALTPTVITVTPMNGTQTRSRSEDALNGSTKRLISSLHNFGQTGGLGCEDRILCELLISASGSKNAEQHVENLLSAFTRDGKAFERAAELKKVFEAVKSEDCQPIICKNIKEKKT